MGRRGIYQSGLRYPKVSAARGRPPARRDSKSGPTGLLFLADDPVLQGRLDAGVEPDDDLVLAERLDRGPELDRAVIEVEAGPLQLLRDVAARHRAEQLLVLADVALELERHAVEALGDAAGGRLL